MVLVLVQFVAVSGKRGRFGRVFRENRGLARWMHFKKVGTQTVCAFQPTNGFRAALKTSVA